MLRIVFIGSVRSAQYCTAFHVAHPQPTQRRAARATLAQPQTTQPLTIQPLTIQPLTIRSSSPPPTFRPSAHRHQSPTLRPSANRHQLPTLRPSANRHQLPTLRPSAHRHQPPTLRPSAHRHQPPTLDKIRTTSPKDRLPIDDLPKDNPPIEGIYRKGKGEIPLIPIGRRGVFSANKGVSPPLTYSFFLMSK